MHTEESKTVLVIEDNAGVASVLKAVLQASGFSVLLAGSGSDALEVASDCGGEIDLVIADVVLPDMKAPKLRKLFEVSSQARWLYISGYTRSVLWERYGIEIGSDNLLEKPFMPHILLRKIRAVLDGGSEREAPAVWA